jgi:chitin synthase
MPSVYEYFISHHLAKAFESLFGSVTCLPGCFSLYRIRSADKGRPLFVSNKIIDDYSENKVDTLHKKNLLALGEDRYLTTLLLKHFPAFRTKFTPDAHALTSAPERWGVLLSQRRRWINSTVHNLAELVLMPELCGFCLVRCCRSHLPAFPC